MRRIIAAMTGLCALLGLAAAAHAAAQFDAEAATAAYLATIPPKARARSDAYFEGGYWLQLWDLLVGLAVAWLLLGTGWSRRVRDFAERMTRSKWLQATLYGAIYILLDDAADAAVGGVRGLFPRAPVRHVEPGPRGLVRRPGKGLTIDLVFGTLAVTAILRRHAQAPRTWWLWGAALVVFLFAFQC